jgi:hypothetical protein
MKKKKKPRSRAVKQAARRERKLEKTDTHKEQNASPEHTNDQASSKALYDPLRHACSNVSCDPLKH